MDCLMNVFMGAMMIFRMIFIMVVMVGMYIFLAFLLKETFKNG